MKGNADNEIRKDAAVKPPGSGAARRNRGYAPVAVNLYSDQIDWANRAALSLRRAGAERCSRSRVIQEAIECLKDFCQRQGFDDEGLEQFFRRNQARRRARRRETTAE
jgi:hypothetical protein